MHCIAVSTRVCRSRLLVAGEPKCRAISRALMGAPAVNAVLEAASGPPNLFATLVWDPKLILEWIAASMDVKDIRKIGRAAKSFATIFARGCGIPKNVLLSNAPKVCPEVIRLGRVRADVVSMLLTRKMLQETLLKSPHVNIFVYIDGSPQWRGLEMLATSIDIQDGQTITRRLLPLISLESYQFGALWKVAALLWQLFLVVGPLYSTMRLCLRRIRGVLTDFGTERKIADYTDLLGDWYEVLDRKFKAPNDLGEYLLPRALLVPGWRHLFDVVIRRSLCSLDYFPGFVDKLKAIVSFLRQSTILSELARDLTRRGYPGVADLLCATSFPSFAQWRWGTLRACCSSLGRCLDSLRQTFDPSPWRGSRDGVRLRKVIAALRCPLWRAQFTFVKWFSEWLGGLQSWAGGCSRHDRDCPSGCEWKGRRLPEAHEHASARLREGLAEATAWSMNHFGGYGCLWHVHVGCVRGAFRLGMQKISFLDKVPYLFARLESPGVRDRCLEQYATGPPHNHHKVRVTEHYFSLAPLAGVK
jgi:hypothetical protein